MVVGVASSPISQAAAQALGVSDDDVASLLDLGRALSKLEAAGRAGRRLACPPSRAALPTPRAAVRLRAGRRASRQRRAGRLKAGGRAGWRHAHGATATLWPTLSPPFDPGRSRGGAGRSGPHQFRNDISRKQGLPVLQPEQDALCERQGAGAAPPRRRRPQGRVRGRAVASAAAGGQAPSWRAAAPCRRTCSSPGPWRACWGSSCRWSAATAQSTSRCTSAGSRRARVCTRCGARSLLPGHRQASGAVLRL